MNVTNNSLDELFKWKCQICYYFTNNKGDLNKHLKTIKHIKNKNGDNGPKIYKCSCGKVLNNRQGLYRHKQICNNINTNK